MEAGGAVDVTSLPKLFSQVRLTGDAEHDAATILALTEGPQGPENGLRSKGALPNLELGMRASFTTRQWRERERKNHKKSVRCMQSPTKREITSHMRSLDRAAQILSFGTKNKANALQAELDKLARENAHFAQRLVKLQNTSTEITETNRPGKQPAQKALDERIKYLAMARAAAQTKLDFENSLILKRLATANSTVPPRHELRAIHKRNRRIRRNMCKLAVPPHEHAKFLEARQRKRSVAAARKSQAGRPVASKQKLKPAVAHNSDDNNDNDNDNDNKSKSKVLLRPLHQPELAHTSSEPWLTAAPKTTAPNQLPVGASRPISRAQDQALGVPQLLDDGGITTLKSNQDRGQICHEWVHVKHAVPGEQMRRERVLVVAFRKPNDEGKLIFELSIGSTTRYAQVTYEQMKAALEEAAALAEARAPPGEDPTLSQPPVTLASAAAERLTLFGNGADMSLVWNEL